jgi:hypothetical protein
VLTSTVCVVTNVNPLYLALIHRDLTDMSSVGVRMEDETLNRSTKRAVCSDDSLDDDSRADVSVRGSVDLLNEHHAAGESRCASLAFVASSSRASRERSNKVHGKERRQKGRAEPLLHE